MPEENEIIKEFDEKFNKFGECNPPHCQNIYWGADYREVEQFILTKLKEEYERGKHDGFCIGISK